jgi:DNA invertase Pin-like site-specific DNA recombinase
MLTLEIMGSVMKYGYARVSTVAQNVNQQAEKLIEQHSIDPENIIQEVWTGKTTERPALQKLVNKTLKPGDKLHVFHVSRLGRKASEVLQLVDDLKERDIGLVVYELDSTDLTTPTGKLLLTMLAGLAEMELETLRERQRIGIDRAKKEGKYTGRKPVDPKIIDTALQLKSNGVSIDAIAAQLRLGRSTLYREFGKRGQESKFSGGANE